ncbi:hypothetical protein MKW94_017815 [Papaver nudicaule]|uniref:C2 domain-containing protein n=1 Tax=Papaver nudicaule TaxID=74823 RepID=A0AA41S2R5_PAPNU|nr:hypothetical protein [Papaver nudicaule]
MDRQAQKILEDLRRNGRPVKNTLLVVQTDYSTNHRSTSVDTEGGSYPSWIEKIELPLYQNVRFIRVEAQYKTSSSAKMIGEVKIPISDFLGSYFPPFHLHFLSYRLRDRDGERNGIINLSIRVVEPHQQYLGGIAVGYPVSYGCKV